jgi:hypothetical protein
MVEEPKTATEIARLIKERAYIQLGPWPVDLQLIISVRRWDGDAA